MKILLLNTWLWICSAVMAQSFTAETGYIYTGDTNKDFFGSVEIKSGTLKKTDKLDIYAETGRKFEVVIKKITAGGKEVQSAKAGQTVTIDFVTSEDATTGNDYLRKGYKVYPKGFKATVVKTNNITGQPDKFTATLDGRPYRAASFNNGYYKKGIKGFAYDMPFLQLSLVNNDTTDTRSFVLQVFNPKEMPATYGPESSELNFSGAADGKKEHAKVYGYVKGAKEKFTIIITKWEKKANGKLLVSGKMEGNITQVLGKKEILKLENGVFENVEVSIFTQQETLQKKL
jgi:hypothetical protein